MAPPTGQDWAITFQRGGLQISFEKRRCNAAIQNSRTLGHVGLFPFNLPETIASRCIDRVTINRAMNISNKQTVPSESLERKVKSEIGEKQQDNERDSQAATGSKGSLKSTSKNGEDKAVLIQPFFSSRVLEWAVHLLAVSISIIGIFWLRFLNVYWTDESTWTTSWAWAFFGLDGILKALQLITNVHMLLMIASIANITVNFARPRLVGHRSVAFGPLITRYKVDGAANIL